ncbi:hypothetical protein ACJ73_01769 [Blastomyces percursus]|uniref:Uncharacterized protein n=1 Tax=Blastomyces percursus TaxID=1658174 RepID=A0A1J9QEE0_9EURO|nr:hypothetical protein ACJ73_01769 [Blastomyces percursus]
MNIPKWLEEGGRAQLRPDAKQHESAAAEQYRDELMRLVEAQAAGPMTDRQLLIPQMPKKRPSSEALGGDAERSKRPNQGVEHSQGTSREERGMLDPGLFVAQQQREREQVSGKERVEKPIPQRRRLLEGEYYCGSCDGMRRVYDQETGEDAYTITSNVRHYFQRLHETKFLQNRSSEELISLTLDVALVAIKRSKLPVTDKPVAVERRLTLAIQRVCRKGGLSSPRNILTNLLSLCIGRLTYYFGSTELLVDDAEFEDGDRVAIYLKSDDMNVDGVNVDGVKVDDEKLPIYVLYNSITGWLEWGQGRHDQYLTQAYGFAIY